MLPNDPPFEPKIKMLATPRLSIRIDTEQAYRQMFETGSDAAIKAHFGIATDEELQTQKDKVHGGLTTYRTALVFFHLIERAEQKVIGSFAFHNWHPLHRRSEIGYAIGSEAYKGKGYMREAFPPIIAFGFEEMGLNRMEAFIHPDNAPSRKLVMGAGFQQEGWLREHYSKDGVTGDSLVYGLLLKDYTPAPGE
jgi:ribosomal-protein-alanine N-acetyltransferase